MKTCHVSIWHSVDAFCKKALHVCDYLIPGANLAQPPLTSASSAVNDGRTDNKNGWIGGQVKCPQTNRSELYVPAPLKFSL